MGDRLLITNVSEISARRLRTPRAMGQIEWHLTSEEFLQSRLPESALRHHSRPLCFSPRLLQHLIFGTIHVVRVFNVIVCHWRAAVQREL